MSFSEVLKELAEGIPGSKGAAVVGMDGIIVEELAAEAGVDLQSVGAEYGNLLKGAQAASRSLQIGKTEEISIAAERAWLVMRKINEDYFIALLLSPESNMGKGRFLLRIAADKLIKEF
jgi:predicted regulator of Ras-like GTPase activity (Roadblock/LC7/MglB family)